MYYDDVIVCSVLLCFYLVFIIIFILLLISCGKGDY